MAKKIRPRVGVTGPDKGGWPSWLCTRWLVRASGGIPVRITPSRPRSLQGLQALILGGGADIDPARYGESILPSLKAESRHLTPGRILHFVVGVLIWLLRRLLSVPSTSKRQDHARDELEFALLAEALALRMPVLGICRGGQLINVHFGGALYQDISAFYNEHPRLRTIRARKKVCVEKGSRLARLVCGREVLVNSLHNQSVKTLGQGLRVAAREPNGVIQAIEHDELPFVMGVQWHPEFLPTHRQQRRIFHFLVEGAKVFALRNPGTLPPDVKRLRFAQS